MNGINFQSLSFWVFFRMHRLTLFSRAIFDSYFSVGLNFTAILGCSPKNISVHFQSFREGSKFSETAISPKNCHLIQLKLDFYGLFIKIYCYYLSICINNTVYTAFNLRWFYRSHFHLFGTKKNLTRKNVRLFTFLMFN